MSKLQGIYMPQRALWAKKCVISLTIGIFFIHLRGIHPRIYIVQGQNTMSDAVSLRMLQPDN